MENVMTLENPTTNELIEILTTLPLNESVQVKSAGPLTEDLLFFLSQRFQGLIWSSERVEGGFLTTFQNREVENCCGCCGKDS